MEENEARLRVFTRLDVDLEIRFVRGDELITYCTRDLSAGGFQFKSSDAFQPGEVFPVSFDLPTGEVEDTIVAKVEIKRVEPIEGSWTKLIGASFKEIPEGARERIHHFIARIKKLSRDEERIALERKEDEDENNENIVNFPGKLR